MESQGIPKRFQRATGFQEVLMDLRDFKGLKRDFQGRFMGVRRFSESLREFQWLSEHFKTLPRFIVQVTSHGISGAFRKASGCSGG